MCAVDSVQCALFSLCSVQCAHLGARGHGLYVHTALITALLCTKVYITIHCTVHYTALDFPALHCTALICTELHYIGMNCNALYGTALHCTQCSSKNYQIQNRHQKNLVRN